MPSRRLKQGRALRPALVADGHEGLVVGRPASKVGIRIRRCRPMSTSVAARRRTARSCELGVGLPARRRASAAVPPSATNSSRCGRFGTSVPIEAGREGEVVLGEVDDACRSARPPPPRGRSAPSTVIGSALDTPPAGHLEHVPVLLEQRVVRRASEVGADVGAVDGLLARQPADPHGVGPPAQFICVPLSDTNAADDVALPVDVDRDRAAVGELVVAGGRRRRAPARTHRRAALRVAVDLVVAHDDRAAVRTGERAPSRRGGPASTTAVARAPRPRGWKLRYWNPAAARGGRRRRGDPATGARGP